MLSSKYGLVRKSGMLLMQVPRVHKKITSNRNSYQYEPPALANSFAKSGTYLLAQILEVMLGGRRYGNHLSTVKTSLYQRRYSDPCIARSLRRAVPGEILPAHLFWSASVEEALNSNQFKHFFIFRDPRAIVLSEVDYITNMASWHVNHKLFKHTLKSDAERIEATISGVNPQNGKSIGLSFSERMHEFTPWLTNENVCLIRFESLVSKGDFEGEIEKIIDFYNRTPGVKLVEKDRISVVKEIINPTRSHTYSGIGMRNWQGRLTGCHLREIEAALPNIISLYE